MKEEEGPPHFAYKRLRVSTPMRLVTIRLFVLTIITIFQFYGSWTSASQYQNAGK